MCSDLAAHKCEYSSHGRPHKGLEIHDTALNASNDERL